MTMEIIGSVALVTGASSGLGEATARALAQAGASVVLVDRDAARGKAVADDIGARAVFIEADVVNPDDVATAVSVGERLGPLRMGVSCAGIAYGERGVSRDGRIADLDNFRRVIEVNLVGTYNVMCQVAAAAGRADPDEDGQRGVIVNTSSIAAFEGQIGQGAYAASKGGVASLTLTMAREFAAMGVRVCAIAPGPMDTPMLASLSDAVRLGLAENLVFPKRLAHPAEFASLVTHIVTNSYINGEIIRFDAGLRPQSR